MLVFGPLREQVGVPKMRVRGSTVREVWLAVLREHPRAARTSAAVRPARNLTYCDWDSPVQDGDPIAFIPPVAGGSTDIVVPVRVAITDQPIDVAQLIGGIGSARDGAVTSFVGIVRDHSDGHAVSRIDTGRTRRWPRVRCHIGDSLYRRGGISTILVVHRVGLVEEVGEASVVIAVAAAHRDPAFAACHDAIAMIKRSVPVWKREHRDDGAHWVDARQGAHREAAG